MARTDVEPRGAISLPLGDGEPATPPRSRPALAGEDAVPRRLASAAAIVARLLILFGGLWLLGFVALKLLLLVIPLVVALLVTTLFAPSARTLERHG